MYTMKTNGLGNWAANFFLEEQLKDSALWKKFVDVFRYQPDAKIGGWCGEYWGKMMRGASLVYAYTQDEELYDILTETVQDMLTVAAEDGRVSSYPREQEFICWDLWCRKYVILACEYYLDICRDSELKEKILQFICRCADYIMAHIGSGDGLTEITDDASCLLKMQFTDKAGNPFYLVDYASAGKDWETEIAAWLRTK